MRNFQENISFYNSLTSAPGALVNISHKIIKKINMSWTAGVRFWKHLPS